MITFGTYLACSLKHAKITSVKYLNFRNGELPINNMLDVTLFIAMEFQQFREIFTFKNFLLTLIILVLKKEAPHYVLKIRACLEK